MATTSHRYSLQEHLYLLPAYYHFSSKYKLIFNDHQERFENSLIPRWETVYHIAKCFEKMGSVEDSKHTSHPYLVRTEENMQQVGQAFIETPAQSARRFSWDLDISDRFLWRIMRSCFCDVCVFCTSK